MPKSVDIARLHVIGHDQEHALGSLHGAILLSLHTERDCTPRERAHVFHLLGSLQGNRMPRARINLEPLKSV